MFATTNHVVTSDTTRSTRPMPPPLPRPVVLYEFEVKTVDAKTRKARTLVTTVAEAAEARERAAAYGLTVVSVKCLGVAESPVVAQPAAGGEQSTPRPKTAKPGAWQSVLLVVCLALTCVSLAVKLHRVMTPRPQVNVNTDAAVADFTRQYMARQHAEFEEKFRADMERVDAILRAANAAK
ncbi:MAG TPA: hypothetical protein VEA69_05420 [Tepidisphaeraceae bacterium]|nr:hypothetical protein [Tepidisphaeraceae bacterium]